MGTTSKCVSVDVNTSQFIRFPVFVREQAVAERVPFGMLYCLGCGVLGIFVVPFADAELWEPPADPRLLDEVESEVVSTVVGTLLMYGASGTDAFADITPGVPVHTSRPYPFVLNASTMITVADGAFPYVVGDPLYRAIKEAGRPTGAILEDLYSGHGTWIEHMSENPDTGAVQLKRSWLYLHDGYVFGSGYYPRDFEVVSLVEGAVNEYRRLGEGVFDAITPAEPLTTNELYVFVLDAGTDPDRPAGVAHGTTPSLVGVVPERTFLYGADRPYEAMLSELEEDGTLWISYVFVNPDTHTRQAKRTYLSMHDGFIFASGYYTPDERVQSAVDRAMLLYRSAGEAAFGQITTGSQVASATYAGGDIRSTGPHLFVLEKTGVIRADSAYPGRVGTVFGTLHEGAADRSYSDILDDIDRDGGTWLSYMSANPAAGSAQLTRAWATLLDGYLFVADYHMPDSRAQSVVDETISRYRSTGPASFERLVSEDRAEGDSLYPVVLQRRGAETVAVGTSAQVWLDELRGLPVQADRDFRQVLADAYIDGATWTERVLVNPATGTEQVMRQWWDVYGDYIFVSGYYLPDAEVQSAVDEALVLFGAHGEDAFGMMTPQEPRPADETHVFVIDSDDYTTVADGALPQLVGSCCADAIRHTGDRPFEQVLADLDQYGGAWVTHDFTDPDTGTVQPKRSWLYERDGFIFVSGYYVSDSRAQALVQNAVFGYGAYGGDGIIRMINDSAAGPPDPLRPFVVDASTWMVLAHGVDASYTGETWPAIVPAGWSAGDILEDLTEKAGVWVEYEAVNPATGQTEPKRSWLHLQDGLIFGSGYHAGVDSVVGGKQP